MICPECKREIEGLKHEQTGSIFYECWLNNSEDRLDFQEDKFIPDDNTNNYFCPECLSTLFTESDSVVEFLKKERA